MFAAFLQPAAPDLAWLPAVVDSLGRAGGLPAIMLGGYLLWRVIEQRREAGQLAPLVETVKALEARVKVLETERDEARRAEEQRRLLAEAVEKARQQFTAETTDPHRRLP